MLWQTTRFDIDLRQPQVMGIVNLTPDSFSDGGRFDGVDSALRHAEMLLHDGAHILDVGGESTRPGAAAVPADVEWQRMEGFLRQAVKWQVPISVDTYKAQTMRRALDMGVDIINDIWALRQEGALAAVAEHARCGVCLMHMHRDPQTMQLAPMQGDVLATVAQFLHERTQCLLDCGVQPARVVWDCGIGFGKTLAQNFSLLAHQHRLGGGYPLLAGWSRKSSLGALLARDGLAPPAQQRVSASVAAALLAVQRGAHIVRVHDVRETVDALRVWQAVQETQ